MAKRRDLTWLTRAHVEAIHAVQLSRHGGRAGLRDEGALESALGRPQGQWHHREDADVASCAAAHGFAIAKNQAVSDANRRTAFVTMATFFELRGFRLTAAEPEAVAVMFAIAAGDMSAPGARRLAPRELQADSARHETQKVRIPGSPAEPRSFADQQPGTHGY